MEVCGPSIEATPNRMQHQDYAQMLTSSASTLHEVSVSWIRSFVVLFTFEFRIQSPMVGKARPEPLSAYARWKLEEDERFYTIFPEARSAAHQYDTLSSAYLVGTGFYYDEEGRIARSDEPMYYDNALSTSPYEDNSTSLNASLALYDGYSCRAWYKDSDLSRALVLPSREGTTGSNAPSPDHSDSESAPDEMIQTNLLVPSQYPQPSTVMDSLLSEAPTSQDTSLPQLSGYLNYAPDNTTPKTDPMCYPYANASLHHTYPQALNFYSASTTPAGWPSAMCMSSRSIRLSPLPPSKRPIAKKPPLACHFCRGRKIACGPPDPGSSDRSCNQCQRRSIKCEYPAESRRGMRKKNALAHPKAAVPKNKVGRKQRIFE
ncbi:hypothetical protein H0H92_001889 [Tricholoma furcatifolium]|nr:hypothetical protein H0H92_001889 [Tricholoma furcatifolium]